MPEKNTTNSDAHGDQPCQSRRMFLRTACAPAVLASLGISLASCSDANIAGPDEDDDDPSPDEESGIAVSGNTIELDLTKSDTQTLMETGGFLLISQADTMAVNVGDSTIRAFTSICTHQQCTIDAFGSNVFQCPCHGSEFDTSGDVVNGPAEQALAEYSVSRSDNTVTITK